MFQLLDSNLSRTESSFLYTSLGLFLSWAKNQWIQLMSQGTMLVKAGIGAQTAFGGS